ncbi:unnamed protein product [Rotaria magnacalcarata]|uniref:G-protein coupled receptors family 1 profile domain-containing protein n=1 Tax=Rotaria magnacalcarata TaxID=392030 RepID=A0A819UCB9_9BILA|nr:unnamed protein product [Rotaria magnacalcarata]
MGGIIGSSMLVFIFMTVSYYRKTPCTFYFLIAAIHEFGLFITAICPYVIAAGLDVDLTRVSIVWCKLRYFLAAGFGAVSTTCACLAVIDQFLITSQHAHFRQKSTMKIAYRTSLLAVIIWWLHSCLWLYFQDMSPKQGTCIYRTKAFFTYTTLLFCIGICIIPILTTATFGILTYRNIKNIIVLTRFHIDRQFTIIVFSQVLLSLIGLGPYGIYLIYLITTTNIKKNADRTIKESLVANIAYLFCSVAYGVKATLDQSKFIIFEYKKNEKSFKIHRKLPYENLLHVVKVTFDLPDDAALVLLDPVTRCSIASLATFDLWAWTDCEVPKYRIIVRNETCASK